MSDDTQSKSKPRSVDVAPEARTGDEIDMAALVAAVERLLRRDLDLERERLRGGERGDIW